MLVSASVNVHSSQVNTKEITTYLKCLRAKHLLGLIYAVD